MNKITLRQWLPLVGMTLAAFVFNTSEFMPVGLLTSIASTFAISESTAGIMITVYSWSVMILSLPLMILASKLSYRRILLLVLSLFAVGQILSGIATTYVFLVLARVVVACAHAVFWAAAPVIAVRLVDESHSDLAMSMVITGSSIAMICGLPIGRVIGLVLGWRMTFVTVGIIAAILLVFQFVVFPHVAPPEPFTLDRLPDLLRNRALVILYVVTVFYGTGYYTAYSYIEPFLQDVGISAGWITIVISIFGVAGLAGSAVFSRYYSRDKERFLLLSIIGIVLSLLLLRPAGFSMLSVILVCVFWGFAGMAFGAAAQSEVIRWSGQDSTVAMAIYSGLMNCGIGMGSFVGGQTVDRLGIGSIGYVGMLFVAVSAVIYAAAARKNS